MSFDLYAIGNALVDSEYLVNDDFLQAQNIQKGQMTLIDQAQQQQLISALNQQFRQQNPQVMLKVVTGSSGNLFAQIQQNAPFEVCLSADVLHPQQR